MRKVGARGDERGIEIDGPLQPPHRILHPVPLQSLPLMMRSQIELVRLAMLRRGFMRSSSRRNGRDGKAAATDSAAHAVHQLPLELDDPADPKLGPVRNPDHLRPQPEPLRRCMQLPAKNQIRLERLADLVRCLSAPRQCEH